MDLTLPGALFNGTDDEADGETRLENAVTYMNFDDEKYCSAYHLDDDNNIVITVTQTQRDNIIQSNEAKIKNNGAVFLNADSDYSYSISEDFTEVTIYADENNVIEFLTIMANAHLYTIMNYILYYGTEDYSIHLSVYNCHNGNLVSEYISQPGNTEGWEINDEDWVASY